MPDFSNRGVGTEIMDDLQTGGPDLWQALFELDAINYLLGGNYVTLNGLSSLLSDADYHRDLHIADLGCGSGDMLRRIRSFLQKRKTEAVLSGFDANPNVVKYADDHTPPACRIHYEALNIFSSEFQRHRFDIVVGTLFFHHFTNEELIGFFRNLKEQVRMGIIINDIHRHWLAYYSIKWLTQIFSRSAMVRHDAPLSVRRAFRKRDLEEILRRAGFMNYKIKWRWAFRWQVIIPMSL